MTISALIPANEELAARRHLPVLLALFVGSGVCALIYEVVWFQLLQNVIGSTAVSLGVLLATYMGGMCIGSLLLPRFVPAGRHPLKVYAALELGIGVIALVALVLVPLVGRLFTAAAGPALGGVFLRGVVCAICLLPPTILMGATLPAASRWIETTPRGVSWIGLLYGANTIGAVFGGALAGFFLLRFYDIATATTAAAFLNVCVAASAYQLSRRTEAPPVADRVSGVAMPAAAGSGAVYLTIALSGACALGAEVVWTRLLSLMLGGTVYTFAMILAVFLFGLGLGSAGGAWLSRRSARPRLVLGWCQLLQTLAVAWAALMLADVLPYWPINPSLAQSPWLNMHVDVTRTLWVVLPAAMLWGASFPLAIASVALPGADSARLVGRVYAANTVGAIAGALAFSLLVIPLAGTHAAHVILIGVSALSAIVVFGLLLRSSETATTVAMRPAVATRTAVVSLVLAVALGTLLMTRVPEVPGLLVAYGRYLATWIGQVDVLYVGEGMNSSIAVSRLHSTGATQFHVAGKVEASSLPQDMRLQRMLGHLPALMHPNPKSVLVVGFGAGVTAGSLIVHPEVQRMVICEIEPLIPKVMSQYFAKENHDVFRDPRVRMVYDDARSFVLTTRETFDLITSDPIHPWVKGAASLYTREYFEEVRRHLNPGGVVSQWVPLYESSAEAVKSEIATFFEVFPNGTIWANNMNGQGYDLVLVGSLDDAPIDIAAVEARLARANEQPVVASMGDVGFGSLIDLFATYAGRPHDLAAWLGDAEINRDRSLRLQYIAGLGANRYQSQSIFDELVAGRSFPDHLFRAGDAWKEQLRAALLGSRY